MLLDCAGDLHKCKNVYFLGQLAGKTVEDVGTSLFYLAIFSQILINKNHDSFLYLVNFMQTLEKQFSAYLQSISLFAYLFLIKQEFICEVCPAQADDNSKHKLQLSSLGL